MENRAKNIPIGGPTDPDGLIMANYNDWLQSTLKAYPNFMDSFGPLSHAESKTCGHLAHLNCFQTYKLSAGVSS